jgi:hypothetical protein
MTVQYTQVSKKSDKVPSEMSDSVAHTARQGCDRLHVVPSQSLLKIPIIGEGKPTEGRKLPIEAAQRF